MKRFASALVLVLSGCGDYPRDTDGTLDRVRGGVVRVGVVAGSADPREAALVSEVARRTGAKPQVATGPAEPLLLDLEKGELDLVVGAFDVETPWADRHNFSKPVATLDLEGTRELKAATRNGEHAWAMEVDRAAAAVKNGR